MRPTPRRSLTAFVCALLCTASTTLSPWLASAPVRTEDRNRDGRPDVWRAYGPGGEVATVAVDTNLDGRSDLQEFYVRGALIRREFDRDFNDRVDLVQEFDPVSREVIRSVADLNADGVADLLVLFREGAPVFSTRAPQARPSAQRTAAGARPAPLDNPFSTDLVVEAVRIVTSPAGSIAPGPAVGLMASDESRYIPSRTRGTIVLPSSHLQPGLPTSSGTRGPPLPLLFS